MTFLISIIRHKHLVILSFLIVVILAGTGLRHLEFVSDIRVFFSKDNPELQNLNAFERAFAKKEALLLVVVPNNNDIFTAETLQAVDELTRAAWELPTSTRVNSITNFIHTYAQGDELIVEDLVKNPASLTPEQLQTIKTFALSEPLLLRTLVSPAGDVAVVAVTTHIPEGESGNSTHLTAQARELAGQVEQKHQDLKILVTGDEIFNAAFSQISRNDMKNLYPIMLLVMVVMMMIMVRSTAGLISTLIILFASAVTAMGIAGYLGIKLTTASTAAPVIILTLAVADSIHIIVSMLFYMRKGKSKDEAIVEAITVNFQPIFLTSLTTAIGFLTMLTSDSPPFRDLGIIVAIGVTLAFLFSVLVLPALLSVLPVSAKNIDTESSHHIPIIPISRFLIRHKSGFFWFMAGLFLLLSLGIPRIEFYDKFIEYFDKDYEVRQVADFLEDKMSGLSKIRYLMNSGEEGGINDPAFLTTVDKFSKWCLKQPEVVKVSSFVHTVKRLNKNMHGDDQAFYTIPESRELAAQYLLLYEMSLPFGQDLDNVITPDRSAISLSVLVKRISTLQLTRLEDRAAAWLKANAPPAMQAQPTGVGSMFAHISERNIKSMLKSTSIALVVISLILVVSFRSWKFGLFSLLPNIVPAFMTFGLWGLLVGYINMAVSFIAAMSLGIVVDDTVHFISKYLRARRGLKLSPVESLEFAFQTVGVALITTSVILAAGFCVLAFSGFELNATMGILMAITIVFALFADFFFLPYLLLKIDDQST